MSYDRLKEIKDFDESKAGVKGLVDAGILEIPRIFIRPPDELAEELAQSKSTLQLPVVDLSDIEADNRRKKVVDEIREASEKWGFFQLINHGVPSSVLERMIEANREFHEQDAELKKEYYSRDQNNRRVRYESNLDLYHSKTANWRDTLNISMIVSGHIQPQELPPVCRSSWAKTRPLEFRGMYPRKNNGMPLLPCMPTARVNSGTVEHTDPVFLTILLQDQSGGLQFMNNNQWVDVEPIERALVVNIGDLLQILSNDKFASAKHRVLANKAGPRMSVAIFFTGVYTLPKMYGPIKELISEENPPKYKKFVVSDYINGFYNRPANKSGLDMYRM